MLRDTQRYFRAGDPVQKGLTFLPSLLYILHNTNLPTRADIESLAFGANGSRQERVGPAHLLQPRARHLRRCAARLCSYIGQRYRRKHGRNRFANASIEAFGKEETPPSRCRALIYLMPILRHERRATNVRIGSA